jgi:uncharacterized membrane protein YeaQ/YmgE (transglycosylase-associated protein family)
VILWVFLALVVIFVVLPLIGWAVWLLVTTILIGLVVGALARLVVPGRNPIGFLATVACGLAGSILGGAVGRAIHHGRFVTILAEIGVAAVAVAIWDLSHRKALPAGRRPISRW